MRTPSTDIFGPVEENNDENIEDEEQEEDEEVEEQEEEEPEEEETSSSEEEEEADDDNEPDPWHPLRQKVWEDIKKTYLREVQQFLDKGKSQHYAENSAFNALLPVSRRRLRRNYLDRLKWTHHIKHNAIHRKIMKALRRFTEEDDMDFDEAAEWAVAKRKFLLKRLMKKKLLPDDDGDEEVALREIIRIRSLMQVLYIQYTKPCTGYIRR